MSIPYYQKELQSGPVGGDGHWEARSVVDSVEQSEGNQDTRIYEFEDNEGGEGPLSPENSQGLFFCFLVGLIKHPSRNRTLISLKKI